MILRGRCVWPLDWLHFGAFGAHAVLQCFTFGRMENWGWWLGFDLVATGLLLLIIRYSGEGLRRRDVLIRLLFGCAAVPLIFTQVGLTIEALGLPDLAPSLEELDRWLFGGVNPLEACEAVVHPLLTELLQWVYNAYLLLPPAVVLLLALKASPQVIARSIFSLLAIIYLSYLGYYLVPAMGPNIHNNFGPVLPVSEPVLPLYTFHDDLPGVWLARELREWMFAVELTKRDCFPSGHAAIALACGIYAFRVGRRWGWLLMPLALGIVVSTVYLRYHFVIDVIVSIPLTLFGITVMERLHRRFEGVLFSSTSQEPH